MKSFKEDVDVTKLKTLFEHMNRNISNFQNNSFSKKLRKDANEKNLNENLSLG